MPFLRSGLRWQVGAVAGIAVLAVIGIARDPWRPILRLFILCLSINIHYYLTDPITELWIGTSAPTSFSIPLPVFLAVPLLLRYAALGIAGRESFHWGVTVGGPAIAMLGSVALAAQLSDVRLYGIFLLFELVQYYVIFLAVINAVRSMDDLDGVFRALLAVVVLQFTVALLQMTTGISFSLSQFKGMAGMRVTGTVGTVPSGLATFLEPPLFVALALTLPRAQRSKVVRAWAAFAALLSIVAIGLTQNRSSWSGLAIVGFPAFALLTSGRRPIRSLAFAVMGIIVLALAVYPFHKDRLATFDQDLQTRLDLVQPAIDMITSNPVLGVGPGGYSYHLRQYIGHFTGWLYYVHNEYLLVWSERGTLGFLAWIAWFGSGLRSVARVRRTAPEPLASVAAGMQAGLIVILWELMLNSYEPFSSTAMVWVVFALSIAMNRLAADQSGPRPVRPGWHRGISGLRTTLDARPSEMLRNARPLNRPFRGVSDARIRRPSDT